MSSNNHFVCLTDLLLLFMFLLTVFVMSAYGYGIAEYAYAIHVNYTTRIVVFAFVPSSVVRID